MLKSYSASSGIASRHASSVIQPAREAIRAPAADITASD